LPEYISPAIELKNWWVMGQHLSTHVIHLIFVTHLTDDPSTHSLL